MAVLHLQFDVDSEVHPELFAMLSSMGSSSSQGERLRQLAATGLVWEQLRLRGPAPSHPQDDVDPTVAEAFVRETHSAIQELPVLTDVVEPAGVLRLEPATRPPLRPVNRDIVDLRDARHGAAERDSVGANEPIHDLPPARKTATRSRLMRMKDKGLFKNE